MITTDGAVYENLDVTGDIWIDADNVTIRNFRIDADGEYYGIKVLRRPQRYRRRGWRNLWNELGGHSGLGLHRSTAPYP